MNYLIITSNNTPPFLSNYLLFPDWEQVSMIINLYTWKYTDKENWKDETEKPNWIDLQIDHL